MRKKYIVQLTEEEREYLHNLISSGTAPARKLNRARILLKADIGKHAEGEALIDKGSLGCSRPPPPQYSGCESAFTKEDSRPPWNAHCPIGSTSALWRGVPKPA